MKSMIINWNPTTDIAGDERDQTPMQTRILNELRDLKKLGQLNPQDNVDSQTQFLTYFHWTGSTCKLAAKQAVETLLVEFHNISARHRFDIGTNTETKVQLRTLENRSAYSQNLPAQINFKDDIQVDLALLNKYGNIPALPFRKY